MGTGGRAKMDSSECDICATEDEEEEEVVKVDTSQNTCRLVSICAQKTSTG